MADNNTNPNVDVNQPAADPQVNNQDAGKTYTEQEVMALL